LGAAAREHARTAFAPEPRRQATEALLGAAIAQEQRAHAPVPGAGEPAAARFVQTLGEQAGAFVVSLAGTAGADELARADDAVAASSALLVQGDGGLIHWRNSAPDDPHLRWWSGLAQEAAGRLDLAAAEYEAAAALGLDDGRPESRRRAILDS
jgi:hypothetical protein